MTIGQLVARASVEYRCEDVSLGRPDLLKYLEGSADNERAVVLVVDAWASLTSTLRDFLAQIDCARINNYAVLIIEDALDHETVEARDMLSDGLRLAFPVSFTQARGEYFRRGVANPDEVDEAVRKILTSLSDAMVERAAARMRRQGAPMPTLSGKAA